MNDSSPAVNPIETEIALIGTTHIFPAVRPTAVPAFSTGSSAKTERGRSKAETIRAAPSDFVIGSNLSKRKTLSAARRRLERDSSNASFRNSSSSAHYRGRYQRL